MLYQLPLVYLKSDGISIFFMLKKVFLMHFICRSDNICSDDLCNQPKSGYKTVKLNKTAPPQLYTGQQMEYGTLFAENVLLIKK